MHHPLGLAGRARGEGEVGDRVGVARGWPRRPVAEKPGEGRIRPRRRQVQHAAERWQLGKLGLEIGRGGIGAEAGLIKDRRGARARRQRHHLRHGVVAVWRGAADETRARAGEQRRDGLDPAGQPEQHALAGRESVAREVCGDGIGERHQIAPADAPPAVDQRDPVGCCARVAGRDVVDRLVAPQPVGGVAGEGVGAEQGQDRR